VTRLLLRELVGREQKSPAQRSSLATQPRIREDRTDAVGSTGRNCSAAVGAAKSV